MGGVSLASVDGRSVQSAVRACSDGSELSANQMASVGMSADRLVLMAGGPLVSFDASWSADRASAVVRLGSPSSAPGWSWTTRAGRAELRSVANGDLGPRELGRWVEDVVAAIHHLTDAAGLQSPWDVTVDVGAGVASIEVVEVPRGRG